MSLVKLVNVLIGKDFAELVVSGIGPTERDRIERLIARIAEAKVVFLREGEEHDAKTASLHIRQKYETAGPKVRSLDEFIDKVASRSWTTGHPYQVRLEDGRSVDAAAWLRDLARDLTPAGGGASGR